MQQTLLDNLRACVAAYAAAHGKSEIAVWRQCVGNDRFAKRVVEDGCTFTVAVYDRAIAWFSANWPRHKKWPDGVLRPVMTKQRERA